jgi:hypothetical protein
VLKIHDAYLNSIHIRQWDLKSNINAAAHKSAYRSQRVQPFEEVFLKHADPASHT